MNRASIRFRLTAWYAGILAITFAVAGIGVWLALRDSINDTIDKDLRSRLTAMRTLLDRQTREPGEAADDLLEDAALMPAGARFRLADSQGRWLFQSPGTESWQTETIEASRLPTRGRIETAYQNGKPVRVLSARVPPGVIQIGVPLDEFSEMLEAFTWTAVFASPLLLLIASAGGYWMSRRALAPVEQIARAASEIEAQHLSNRLPVRGTGDELDHLSATLNGMLVRLEGVVPPHHAIHCRCVPRIAHTGFGHPYHRRSHPQAAAERSRVRMGARSNPGREREGDRTALRI